MIQLFLISFDCIFLCSQHKLSNTIPVIGHILQPFTDHTAIWCNCAKATQRYKKELANACQIKLKRLC
jgi:hypothetical protein